MTKYRPKYRTVYEMVTKYRDETGHRDVYYLDYTSFFAGEVAVQGEGFAQTVALNIRQEISDSRYTSPHGTKSMASDHGPSKVRGQAIAAAAAAIQAQIYPPVAKLAAARHLALATAASGPHQALHHWLLTLRFDPANAPAAKWLLENTGVALPKLADVLAGTREVTADRQAAALGQTDLTSYGSGYSSRDLFEFGMERGYANDRLRMGFEHQRFDDVPFQPARHAIQFVFNAQHALISRWIDDGFGLTVMDHLHWGFVLGGTSSKTYVYEHAEEKETVMSWGLDAGYALLVGVRGGWLGVFVGLDAAYRYRHVGDVAGSRASLLPRARVEWRVNDRHPVILQGWVGDVLRGLDAGFGAEMVVAVAQGSGFVLGWDHERFDSRMGGWDHDEVINIGDRYSDIFTAGYQFGF